MAPSPTSAPRECVPITAIRVRTDMASSPRRCQATLSCRRMYQSSGTVISRARPIELRSSMKEPPGPRTLFPLPPVRTKMPPFTP